MTSYPPSGRRPPDCPSTDVAVKTPGAQHASASVRTHGHLLQLFDAPRSLADAVSHFLIEGRAQGNHLLAIARASNWELIRAYLERRGLAIDDATDPLTVVDARKLRTRMVRRGVLDPSRMDDTLGGMIAELSAASGGLRVYSELVELFAEEGNFEQAGALEDYWNHLQEKYRFTVLCGYSAAHFADPKNSPHLRAIADRHGAIKSQSSDSLGTWLTTR